MENPNTHFLNLKNLFKGYKPNYPILGFDIKGDFTHFIIKKDFGQPRLFACIFLIFFIIPFLIILPSNFKNVRYWMAGLVFIGIVWIIFKFIVASRSIVVDTISKKLVLEKQNIFKKHISKPILIPFQEFQQLISEPVSKTISKFGHKAIFQRIYILHENRKIFVFEIPQTLSQGKQQETFTKYLEAILKHG